MYTIHLAANGTSSINIVARVKVSTLENKDRFSAHTRQAVPIGEAGLPTANDPLPPTHKGH